MIEENVKKVLSEIPETNPFGEKITVVAAVKFQSAENINAAVRAGVRCIGDNHVQEFRDKYGFIEGNPERHFIGHLQTNKIKYLLGKVDLYQSLDSMRLAAELSSKSEKAGIVSCGLLEVNIGGETSKGGFSYEEAENAYKEIKKLPNLKLKGLMAMLPLTDDVEVLTDCAKKMRQLYDRIDDCDKTYLSMGMSGDWKLCIENGSNMIRLGTSLFGQRNYSK